MAKRGEIKKKVSKNALEKFVSRGTLQPDAVYYFDPPLEAHEIYQLENLLKNLKHGHIVTRPLMDERHGEDQRLLWIETDHSGDLESWQNPDGELLTKEDTINWYNSEKPIDAFYNGRELLNTPNVQDIFDKLYEQEDEFDWVKQSINALPPEFIVSFCKHSLNKHRQVKADSMFRFRELKNVLEPLLYQSSKLSRLNDEWFKDTMEGSRGRIVMYFGTHDGILDWNGWDTCEENSIDSYEFVFPVEMFINIYSGKDQQVMNFDKLTEQDLGLPKGLDRSLLNKMAGGHQLVKLRLEDLTPGLMVKRARGQFLYEIGERMSLNIEGQVYNGYNLINVTNGRSYFTKDSQLLKEFFRVIIDTIE